MKSFIYALAVLGVAAGCEPPKAHDSDSGGGFALAAAGGTFSDGSGRLGLSLLAAITDATGSGSDAPWTGTIGDAFGPLAALTYDAPGPGSHSAWWFGDLPLDRDASYWVQFVQGDAIVVAELGQLDDAALSPPVLSLSADGNSLRAAPVEGALEYECRITREGAVQLRASGPEPVCDVSALPDGAYGARMLALAAWTKDLLKSERVEVDAAVLEQTLQPVVTSSRR